MTGLLTFRTLFARRFAGVGLTLLLSLMAAAAGIALLGVSGWFLTGAALTTAALSFNLFGPSAVVRGLSFVRIGARYGEKLVGHDLTLRLLADIREWLFGRLIPLVPLRGVQWRHGELVSRLVADVEALDTMFITAIGPGLTVVAVGLSLGAVLVLLVPPAAPVFGVGFGIAALAVPLVLLVATRRAGIHLVDTKARLRMAVLDGIEGHADLLVFDRAGHALADMAKTAACLSAIEQRQNRCGATASAAVLFITGLTALGVFLCGLEAVHRGAIGGPLLAGLVLAVLASFETVALVVRNTARAGAALAAASRLKALASAAPAIIEPAKPLRLPLGGSLRFEDVWFSHRPERPLFKGLSLDCPPGSRTAIMGESGCGKSTLLDLALRLIEPETGCVRVAGCDVASVGAEDLHGRVALMSQTTPVFLGTIGDNLRLGQPDATDEALWQTLARARLDAFVAGLPDGLGTWCGEGGRTLSAGQARRLCLARILLTPASILLLDEPTSGLDRKTERAFLETLAEATAGRTVLIVTHAALPSQTADRVFHLVDGRLHARIDPTGDV